MNLPRLLTTIAKLLRRKDGGKFATIKDAVKILTPRHVVTQSQVFEARKSHGVNGVTIDESAPLLYTIADLEAAASENRRRTAMYWLVYCIGFSHKQLLEIQGTDPQSTRKIVHGHEVDVPLPCYLVGTHHQEEDFLPEELAWFTHGSESGYRLINFRPFYKGRSIDEQRQKLLDLEPLHRALESNVLAEALFNIHYVTGRRLFKSRSLTQSIKVIDESRLKTECIVVGPYLRPGLFIAKINDFGKKKVSVITYFDPRSQIEVLDTSAPS